MINRYIDREVLKNEEEMYRQMFLERNVKFINQYTTPTFIYPDSKNIRRLRLVEHIWVVGDKFYKLADRYYGDSKDWWIIAKFNNKPTESHVKIGEKLLIPTPIQEAINVMKG
jgi:hypothetical protein